MRLIILILILFCSKISNARDVIKIENQNYIVPIPSKFCNYSDTAWGIQVIDFLKQQQKKSPTASYPRLVYRLCNTGNNEIFPWGFLGTRKNKYINNQETFNKLKAKLIKKTEIYDKIVKHENKNLKNLLDEYGMNSKIIGYNEPFIVWFDKNVIISSVVSSHLVNNEQYKEKLISADTLLDGIIFTYTTYDDKGELGIDTKSHALDLIENANLLKNMN